MTLNLSHDIHRFFCLATVLTVTGLGTISQPLPSFAAQSDIVFTATLDKAEYAAEEPVNLAFALKNKGNSPVYVNKRFYFGSEETPRNQKEVYAIITAPSGEKLPYKFPY